MSRRHEYHGVDKMDALEAALKEVLATARPPWWRLDLRMTLKRRQRFVLASARYGWPGWHGEAVKCGADPELLTAINALIYGGTPYAPEPVLT